MVISLEGYKTSQQALIGDENAIQKQWQETPGYNMFNTGNTGTTSPAYDTTTVDIDMEKIAKDREVEAGLGITLSSPMTDAEKKQYLNSISDEQYKLMRTYKNQGYSFEASKALMENADTLKNPTKRGTKKYKPKETAGQKAADVGMGILQSPGKRGYNIIGQWVDKTAKRIADKLQGSALQRAVYNGAVKVFGEDAVKAYQDEVQKQIDNGTIFDGRTQTDILTPTLGYQRANYSNWTKAGEFIGDIATDAALSAPMGAALKPMFKTATLGGKALLGGLEGATSMGAFTYGTEGRAPTAGELALGAGLGVAVPLAGAGVKGAKNAIKTEAGAGAEQLIEKITKVSPTKLQKFENQFGENVGKFMNDRGLKTRQDASNYFINNLKKVDEALGSIKGTFKSPVVDDVLTESVEFATKTADTNLNRLLELQQKASKEGLTMSEINEVKRYFEGHTKFTYGKSQDAIKASKATNLDTALREWQLKAAADNGLDNLAQLNRETQASKYILNNAKDAQQGILGAVDVTDELLAIHYGGLDRALATYATKSLLKSAKFQAKAVDILNRLAGHQNIEAILADLEEISRINTEKEFDKLLKKRELDPALPAPKAGGANDAGYTILEQGENMIAKPNGETIIKDSITELPGGNINYINNSQKIMSDIPTTQVKQTTNVSKNVANTVDSTVKDTIKDTNLREKVGDKFYSMLEKEVETINKTRIGAKNGLTGEPLNLKPITVEDLNLSSDLYKRNFEKMAKEELQELQKKVAALQVGHESTKLTPSQEKQLASAKTKAEKDALIKKWQKEYLERNYIDVEKVEEIAEEYNRLLKEHERIREYLYSL